MTEKITLSFHTEIESRLRTIQKVRDVDISRMNMIRRNIPLNYGEIVAERVIISIDDLPVYECKHTVTFEDDKYFQCVDAGEWVIENVELMKSRSLWIKGE